MKYHVFIGRWQSPHKGHKWLIDKWLDGNLEENEGVLIMIRDTPQDEKNPFTAEQVQSILAEAFQDEIVKELVKLMIIPDIVSVNYGRGVGYKIIEHEPPTHIKRVSATEIREKIKNSDDSWEELILPGAIDILKKYLKK